MSNLTFPSGEIPRVERIRMPNAKTKVLIVDDDVSFRTSLSKLFDELGYSVRSAADGFAALSEILRDTPDVLLSDLYMPGMSGFVLLSEVHQRFPSIGLVAMSGAFEGNVVPPGVIAAAFYAKGSDLTYLLRIVKAMDRAPCTSFQ
jgi:CheY-like chemotaxis protein